MMTTDDIIKIIAALGVGSGSTAAITAIIAAQSSKGKSRADAADVLIGAAERVGKMNAEQDAEIRHLRNHLYSLKAGMLGYLAEELDKDQLTDIIKGLLNDSQEKGYGN